jgi:ferredoxin/predicted transcriptional regulator
MEHLVNLKELFFSYLEKSFMSKTEAENMTQIWEKVANNVLKAGTIPFQLSPTLIQFLKEKMTVQQAQFLIIFRNQTLNMEEIRKKSNLPETEINKHLEALKQNGVITESKSSRTGIVVYTLMPLFPGMVEFSLMKGQKNQKQAQLAQTIEKLMKELREGTQRNYDEFMPQIKDLPPIARVVPIEQEITVDPDMVIPSEEVSKLIEIQETIGLTHCYCRIQRDLMNKPCSLTSRREICLVFGKVAKHAIKYGFARLISKEEAIQLMRKAEEEGLVHKVFHTKSDPSRELEGLCSCCSCCCGIFRLYSENALPLHTMTSYLSQPDLDNCVGCGVCIDHCPVQALSLENDKISVNKDRCIGCGVCIHSCPQSPAGLKLHKTGQREVFLLPKKIST